MKLTLEEKEFIQQNIKANIVNLALKTHGRLPRMGFLLEQIRARQKAKKKLPVWVNNDDVLFYSKLSTEQCSSELTARHKASLVQGNHLLDLCGGFGVDDVAFSQVFEKVTALEQEAGLVEITQHNHTTLGRKNITVLNIRAEKFLKNHSKKYDCIYVDPARRDEKNTKLVSFLDCSPNVLELALFDYTDVILIKASPMLDISQSIKDLKFIKEIHIVAVNNECKELLFLLEKGYLGKINYTCIDLSTKQELIYKIKNSYKNIAYNIPLKYVYEPNVSIMKAGCFEELCLKYDLEKLHPNTNFFTSNALINDFMGRVFEVEKTLAYKPKDIRQEHIKKANIICRNFPLSPEELRIKFKIKDGGDIHLLFFTNKESKLCVMLTKRI